VQLGMMVGELLWAAGSSLLSCPFGFAEQDCGCGVQ
jgi:hypothetical protein